MTNRPLHRLGLVSVAILLLAFPVTSYTQAAAESALTNALSSSATAKAGSALNHALNQSSAQLGIRIQERTASPVQVGAQQQFQGAPRTAMKGATTRSTSPALSGISVQGGETPCASVSPPNPASSANLSPAKTGLAKTDPGKLSLGTAPVSVDCRGNKSAADTGTGDKYKSFVTLSFPK